MLEALDSEPLNLAPPFTPPVTLRRCSTSLITLLNSIS